VQLHVALGEDDLQRVVEGGKKHVAMDKQATPDQRANALQDNTELVDAGGHDRGMHGRRLPEVKPRLNPARLESPAPHIHDIRGPDLIR
jgi:hypothetical protein